MKPLAMITALAAVSLSAQKDIRQQFVGNWELVSYERRAPSGEVLYPLGINPVGRISYDATGHMSAHLMRRDLPKFKGDDRTRSTAEEVVAAWHGYIGYFGTYTVDEKLGAVIHHVEGAWYPNYVGTKQVRFLHFEGRRLTLEADSPAGRAKIVWQRSAPG